MRLEWSKVSRWPAAPWWAVGVVGLWLALVAGVEILSRASGLAAETCLVKRLTGYPCPTCGLTRAALAAARLEPLRALGYNPLFVSLGAALGAALLLRVVFGRAVRLNLSRREGHVALAAFLALLAADWAYVMCFVG